MKKISKILIPLVVVVILISWFVFKNKPMPAYVPIEEHIPSYVSVVSGLEADNYYGGSIFGQDNTPVVRVDLRKITNINAADFDYGFGEIQPVSGAYVLLSQAQGLNTGNLRLINLKDQAVENYPFPEIPAFGVDIIWIGDRLLMHYFSAGGLTVPHINRDTPRDDHFYFFNTDVKKYIPIQVDAETSKFTAHGYEVYFSKKSDASIDFAAGYCSGRDFLGECSRYGFSLSNGNLIKKMFEIDSNGHFEWGWKDGNFFVKNGTEVFLVDPSKVSW